MLRCEPYKAFLDDPWKGSTHLQCQDSDLQEVANTEAETHAALRIWESRNALQTQDNISPIVAKLTLLPLEPYLPHMFDDPGLPGTPRACSLNC